MPDILSNIRGFISLVLGSRLGKKKKKSISDLGWCDSVFLTISWFYGKSRFPYPSSERCCEHTDIINTQEGKHSRKSILCKLLLGICFCLIHTCAYLHTFKGPVWLHERCSNRTRSTWVTLPCSSSSAALWARQPWEAHRTHLQPGSVWMISF